MPPLQEKKVEIDAVENEKDVTTEKEVKDVIIEETPTEEANKTAITENGDETLNETKPAEEVTADSQKKPKKEKVKKKWSFRSISFSKKDKQKPSKKDKKDDEKKDDAAAEKTTNGECEKVPEEVSDFYFGFVNCFVSFILIWDTFFCSTCILNVYIMKHKDNNS